MALFHNREGEGLEFPNSFSHRQGNQARAFLVTSLRYDRCKGSKGGRVRDLSTTSTFHECVLVESGVLAREEQGLITFRRTWSWHIKAFKRENAIYHGQ